VAVFGEPKAGKSHTLFRDIVPSAIGAIFEHIRCVFVEERRCIIVCVMYQTWIRQSHQ
jgi:hypothetical protein